MSRFLQAQSRAASPLLGLQPGQGLNTVPQQAHLECEGQTSRPAACNEVDTYTPLSADVQLTIGCKSGISWSYASYSAVPFWEQLLLLMGQHRVRRSLLRPRRARWTWQPAWSRRLACWSLCRRACGARSASAWTSTSCTGMRRVLALASPPAPAQGCACWPEVDGSAHADCGASDRISQHLSSRNFS